MVLSLVLLAGAGLLIQSVARFAAAPVGFQAAGLVRYHLALPPRANPEQRARFYRQLLEDLGARTDVGVALSTDVPLRGDGGSNVLEVQGRVPPNAQTAVRDITQQSVSAGYFRVMGIPLQRGRAFIAADSLQTPTVCIINQTLARKYFPDDDPIGHQIRSLGPPDATNPWLTIVGVAGDEKRASVYQEMGWSDASIAYRPLRAAPAANLLVRPGTPGITLGTQVRQRVVELDPNVRIGEAETVEHTISEYLKYPRFRALLLGAFAALALLLAVVGLYGVLSQIVAQRTKEIGLRMALGAPHAQVVAAIVKEGMSLAVVGVALGAVLVAFLSRLISSLLYGVVANDPVTIGGVSLLLLSAAAWASYLPASQAAGIDPMIALRNE
jgi:putative ABC transport system permease protein